MTETGDSGVTGCRGDVPDAGPARSANSVPQAGPTGGIAAASSLVASVSRSQIRDPGSRALAPSFVAGPRQLLALQSLAGNHATCAYLSSAREAAPSAAVLQRVVRQGKRRVKSVDDLLERLESFDLGTMEEREFLRGQEDALATLVNMDAKLLDIDVAADGGVTQLVQAVKAAAGEKGSRATGGESKTGAAKEGTGRCLKSGFDAELDVFKKCRKDLLTVGRSLSGKGVLKRLKTEILKLEHITESAMEKDLTEFDACIRSILDTTCDAVSDTAPPAEGTGRGAATGSRSKSKEEAKSGGGSTFDILMLRSVSDILLPLVCDPSRLVRALRAADMPQLEEPTSVRELVAVSGVFTTLRGKIFTIYDLDQRLRPPADVAAFLTKEFTHEDVARMLSVPLLRESLSAAGAAEGAQPFEIAELRECVDRYDHCKATESLSLDVGLALLEVITRFNSLDPVTQKFLRNFKDKGQDFGEVCAAAGQSKDDSAHCHFGFAARMKSILSQALRGVGTGGAGLASLLAAALETRSRLGLPTIDPFTVETRKVPLPDRAKKKPARAPFPWQAKGAWPGQQGSPPPQGPTA